MEERIKELLVKLHNADVTHELENQLSSWESMLKTADERGRELIYQELQRLSEKIDAESRREL